jgi:hypothetical protein
MPCMEFISHGLTVNRLNSTSPKGDGGFYSPRGECVVREGSSQARSCAGAVSGGAASGHARFSGVDETEMVQLLDSVQVELC